MTERLDCKTPGCKGSILPETAFKTGGLCMPCVHATARREHEAYVRTNRSDLDIFKDVSDPVELLKLVHLPRKHDELINLIPCRTPTDQLYSSLNAEQAQRLAAYALALIGTDAHRMAENICLCLSAFTEVNLDQCLRRFVAEDSMPGLAFRNAPADVRDELLARVDAGTGNRDRALCALAWIGDAVVVGRFASWRRSPPSWRNALHVPPEAYAHEAGWELAGDGQRRDLHFRQCSKLGKGASPAPASFRAFGTRNDHCPCCTSPLTELFSIAPSEHGMNHPAPGETHIAVAMCEICIYSGTVFGVIDGQGRASCPPHTACQDVPNDPDDFDRLPADSLRVEGPRLAFAGADWSLPTTFSQLGGHPCWIQDAQYPQCPECAATMLFLAQLDIHDISPSYEGHFYAFICMPCKMTATTFQTS